MRLTDRIAAVDRRYAAEFGVIETARDGHIIGFHEKRADAPTIPGDPDRVYASMGNYIFSTRTLLRELYADEPVVDLRVLRHSTFAVATAAMFVISIAFYGIMVLSPLYTQILMGYTSMLAGMVLAPGGVATLITMPIAGVLMPRIDPRWVIATGCALNAYAMYLMATLTLEASYWHIMWPRFVQGLGIGFTFVPLSTMALGGVPRRELGHASGLFNFTRTVGGSVVHADPAADWPTALTAMGASAACC